MKPLEQQIEWVRQMRDDHIAGVQQRGDQPGEGTEMIESILRSLEQLKEITTPHGENAPTPVTSTRSK